MGVRCSAPLRTSDVGSPQDAEMLLIEEMRQKTGAGGAETGAEHACGNACYSYLQSKCRLGLSLRTECVCVCVRSEVAITSPDRFGIVCLCGGHRLDWTQGRRQQRAVRFVLNRRFGIWVLACLSQDSDSVPNVLLSSLKPDTGVVLLEGLASSALARDSGDRRDSDRLFFYISSHFGLFPL